LIADQTKNMHQTLLKKLAANPEFDEIKLQLLAK
jgi:hypothetical protein